MSNAFDSLLATLDQLNSMSRDEQHSYMDEILKGTDPMWEEIFAIGHALSEMSSYPVSHTRTTLLASLEIPAYNRLDIRSAEMVKSNLDNLCYALDGNYVTFEYAYAA